MFCYHLVFGSFEYYLLKTTKSQRTLDQISLSLGLLGLVVGFLLGYGVLSGDDLGRVNLLFVLILFACLVAGCAYHLDEPGKFYPTGSTRGSTYCPPFAVDGSGRIYRCGCWRDYVNRAAP